MDISLKDWLAVNSPAERMIWRESFYRQVDFVRYNLMPVLQMYRSFDPWTGELPTEFLDTVQPHDQVVKVINTHMSKSITLPVYSIEIKSLRLTLRGNFDNWVLSVETDSPVLSPGANLRHLFSDGYDVEIREYHCEGFPPSRVFGPYAANRKQFTVGFRGNHELFTFIWQLVHQV